MEIVIKSIFSHYAVKTKEQVAQAYKVWSVGAPNVNAKDKPKFYFEHHIVKGLTFDEFLKVIEEE